MAWLLQRQPEGWPVVHYEMEPSCGELTPSHEYRAAHGFSHDSLTRQGVEIEDRFWPKKARIKSPRTVIPDLTSFCSFKGVSQPFRDCIEALEPDVHDFRKVDVRLRDGTPLDQAYYAMNVRQIVRDAVDWDRTDAFSERYGDERKVTRLGFGGPDIIAMRKSKIHGMHLWISHEISGGAMTLCDDLYGLLKKNKLLRGHDAYEVVEV